MIYLYKNFDSLFERISYSKFRSSFHLNSNMKKYVLDKGFDVVEKHAYVFVKERLKPAYPKNDGKQTPMKQVHPVFIAQHATATCCRGCLNKWHGIAMYKELTNDEVLYIVDVIMKYIKKEVENVNFIKIN